jgi:putative hydrolase of the HAD superfamily
LSKAAVVEKDLVKTLAALKGLGLKLGILSNTFIHSTAIERHLSRLNILDFFSVKLYSYQFGYRKPDVRIFKAAAQRMGERPEAFLFVGDRIGNDIKPALRARMRAVVKAAYTNDGRIVPAGVLKINSLSELPGLVEGLNAGF